MRRSLLQPAEQRLSDSRSRCLPDTMHRAARTKGATDHNSFCRPSHPIGRPPRRCRPWRNHQVLSARSLHRRRPVQGRHQGPGLPAPSASADRMLAGLSGQSVARHEAREALKASPRRVHRRRRPRPYDYSSSPCNVRSQRLLDALNPGTKCTDAAWRCGVTSTVSGVSRTSVAAHTTSAMNHPMNGASSGGQSLSSELDGPQGMSFWAALPALSGAAQSGDLNGGRRDRACALSVKALKQAGNRSTKTCGDLRHTQRSFRSLVHWYRKESRLRASDHEFTHLVCIDVISCA